MSYIRLEYICTCTIQHSVHATSNILQSVDQLGWPDYAGGWNGGGSRSSLWYPGSISPWSSWSSQQWSPWNSWSGSGGSPWITTGSNGWQPSYPWTTDRTRPLPSAWLPPATSGSIGFGPMSGSLGPHAQILLPGRSVRNPGSGDYFVSATVTLVHDDGRYAKVERSFSAGIFHLCDNFLISLKVYPG